MQRIITIHSKTIDEIISRLDRLTREVKAIKTRLFEEEPLYGTDEWWVWSERRADEDIKAGRLERFEKVKDAIKWLNS